MRVPIINKCMIGFICDNKQVVIIGQLRDFLQVIYRVYRTAGIVQLNCEAIEAAVCADPDYAVVVGEDFLDVVIRKAVSVG